MISVFTCAHKFIWIVAVLFVNCQGFSNKDAESGNDQQPKTQRHHRRQDLTEETSQVENFIAFAPDEGGGGIEGANSGGIISVSSIYDDPKSITNDISIGSIKSLDDVEVTRNENANRNPDEDDEEGGNYTTNNEVTTRRSTSITDSMEQSSLRNRLTDRETEEKKSNWKSSFQDFHHRRKNDNKRITYSHKRAKHKFHGNRLQKNKHKKHKHHQHHRSGGGGSDGNIDLIHPHYHQLSHQQKLLRQQQQQQQGRVDYYEQSDNQFKNIYDINQSFDDIPNLMRHQEKWPNLARLQNQLNEEDREKDLPPYIKKFNRRNKQLMDLLEGTLPPDYEVKKREPKRYHRRKNFHWLEENLFEDQRPNAVNNLEGHRQNVSSPNTTITVNSSLNELPGDENSFDSLDTEKVEQKNPSSMYKVSSRAGNFIYHRVASPKPVGAGSYGSIRKQRLPFVAITDRRLMGPAKEHKTSKDFEHTNSLSMP